MEVFAFPMPMRIRTGLLAISDLNDATLAALTRFLQVRLPGATIVLVQAIGSQRHWIADTLMRWCDEEELDLVLTLGGALPAPGPSGREAAPEATLDVLERMLPGVSEAMRAHAAAESRLAYLERGVAGIRGRTVLLNLPAGPAAAVLFLSGAVDLLPAVLAHLQDAPAAPSAEDELVFVDREDDLGETVAGEDRSSTSGLSADEFAAFRRSRRGAQDQDR